VAKKATSKKKTGESGTGARPVLQFRVHEEIYEELKRSAAQHKFSISEEAASRLSSTLKFGGLAPHVPLFPNVERLATLAASAFWHAGQRASGFEDYQSSEFMNDPKCYRAGVAAAVQALLMGMPSGPTPENRRLLLDDLRQLLLPEETAA